MRFCPNCGKEIDEDAVMCLNCCYVIPSADVSIPEPMQKPVEEVKASTGLVVLSIIIPIVGVVLGIVKRKETPKAAKTYLTVGVIAWAVSFLLNMIIRFV